MARADAFGPGFRAKSGRQRAAKGQDPPAKPVSRLEQDRVATLLPEPVENDEAAEPAAQTTTRPFGASTSFWTFLHARSAADAGTSKAAA